MEAVPRLPMLSFELKTSTENTEFGQKLKQYIRDFYHEDPESYTNEIHELEGLRAAAIRVTKDVDGCAILKRYFCQLQFLQSRFPIQEDGPAAVPYYWQDNYSNVVYCTTSVRYELASILYNVGALHTQLGSVDPRTSADGMKMSCTHFQCAAWAFQHLKETLPRPRASDMAPDFMQLFYQICLAQAQECILEKSMMDNRKATIIAKVAAHVVEYYNLAIEALTKNSGESGYIADTVGSKLYKNWMRYLNFKAAYHSCVTLLYQGQAAEEQQKMGERLAFYQAAADKLAEAAKLAKGLDSFEAVAEALQFTQDVVEGKRKAAHNDNEFIYHEKVPDRDSLPTLKGASLVKGIPFSYDDPEVAGPDIFARLVPLRAHEASSLYSEEKAKLLRKVGTQVDEKDVELSAFMASLQLDSLNLHGATGDQLPQELVDACAELNERPEAVQELVQAMDKLAETYHDVEGMLQDIDDLLKEEESKEQSWRQMVGVARPPSIAATELTREAGKYREAHAKAGESNQTLHRAMALHVSNLRTLSKPLPELAQQLPSAAGIGAESEEDKAAIAEVQTLVAKVQEMSSQRAMLTSQLREAVLKDDITTQLVTSAAEGGILDVVFEKELSKHNSQVAIIEQNLSAQTNILRALTDAYARYAPARKAATGAWRKRQATISTLLSSYSAREDLLAKAGKGLEFYRKLESSVSRLLARVRSVCKVQEEERQQQQHASRPSTNIDYTSSSSNAPKLRDYLQNMKHTTPTANLSHIPNVAATAATPYYPSPAYSPAQSPAANTNPTYPATSTPSEAYQWPPSVRPNPVGSEGTDTSICNPKSIQHQNQDLNKPSNTPYIPSQYPYQQYQDPSKSGQMQQQYPASQYYQPNQASQTIVNQTQVVPNQPMSYQNNLLPKVNNTYPQTSVYNNAGQGYQPGMNYPPANYSQHQAVVTTAYSTNYTPTSNTNVTPSAYSSAGYQQPYPATSYQQSTGATMASSYQQPNVTYTAASMQNPAMNYTNTSASPQHIPPSPGQHSSSSYNNLNNSSQQVPQQNAPQNPYQSQIQHQTPQQPQIQQQPSQIPQQPSQIPQQPSQIPQQPSQIPQHPSQVPQQPSQIPQQPTQIPQQQNMQQPGANPQQQSPYQGYNYPTPTSKPNNYVQNQTYPGYQYPAASSTPSVPQAYSTATTIAGSYSQNVTPSTVSYVTQAQSMYAAPGNVAPQTTQASQYANVNQPAYNYNTGTYQYPQNVAEYQQGYGAQVAASTPTTQIWSGNAYNTAAPSNSASQYTSAGKPATQQTNTSQTGVGGQTFAAQYQAATTGSATATPPSTYYSAPYYGYHYPSPTGTTPAPSMQVQQPTQPQQIPQQPQQNQQQGLQQPQVLTYMQAHMPDSLPHTTYCGSPQKHPSESSSNVDLLAGLDFNVSQPPLQPQPKIEPKPAPQPQQTVPSPAKVVPQPVVTEVVETPVTTPAPATPPAVTNVPAAGDAPPSSSSPAKSITQPSSKETSSKEPYADPEALNQFVQEVERLEKVVEGLTNKTLNGPTPLDLKWKELQELQEKDAHKRSISVARCYPMKNRYPDILPFDHSRVELPSTKDDYINASFIKELTPHSPEYILTQAPLPSTYVDFWTMVWEQQTEIVICLLSDAELNGQVYWPASKGEEMSMGKLRISLQTSNSRPNWTERLISVANAETRTSRVVVHLQFNAWPGSSFPASPSGFLGFVAEGLSQHAQQRSSKRPVVVHCLAGVGRSGLFCVVSAAMAEVRRGHGLPDILFVAATMSQQRRGALRDRNHLLFAYQAVLYHCQDLLMKRGILTSRSTFDDALAPRTHARHPSEDFLLGPASLSQLQSGIEKMGLGAANIDWSLPPPVKPVSPPPPSPSPTNTPAPTSSLSDLAAFVPDASSLLANANYKTKMKNNREAFEASRGTLLSPSGQRSVSPQEEADPLSQLDPLWSLK